MPARNPRLRAPLKKSVRLTDAGIKRPAAARPRAAKGLIVPDDLTSALQQNRKALAAFAKLSPSHEREYVKWINEAKRAETRRKRVATTLQWLAEGKP